MSLGVAVRAFFSALSNAKRSEAIRKVLDADLTALAEGDSKQPTLPAPDAKAKTAEPQKPSLPKAAPQRLEAHRSEALTLLAVLQREARLVDLIQEPLDQYGDAQVGAAARPCLKQCRQALQRVFDLQPVLSEPENSIVDVPENASAIRYQWVGDHSTGGSRGRIVHPGWLARKVELPQWTGSEQDSKVVAAVEMERAG